MHEEDGPKGIQKSSAPSANPPGFVPAVVSRARAIAKQYGCPTLSPRGVELVLDLVKNGDGEELGVAMHHHNRAPPSTRALV